MAIASELLQVLRCTKSKAELVYFEAGSAGDDEFLFCPKSRLRYRIDNGIPVMLLSEAEELSKEAADELQEKARSLGL